MKHPFWSHKSLCTFDDQNVVTKMDVDQMRILLIVCSVQHFFRAEDWSGQGHHLKFPKPGGAQRRWGRTSQLKMGNLIYPKAKAIINHSEICWRTFSCFFNYIHIDTTGHRSVFQNTPGNMCLNRWQGLVKCLSQTSHTVAIWDIISAIHSGNFNI